MDSREQVKSDRRPRLLSRLRPAEAPPVGVEPLLRVVKSYNPKADLSEIQDAYRLAEASHSGQKRASGEDFIEHPLSVAQILADLHLDTTTIVAALLHDTVEDTDVSLEQLERQFGPEVTRIVDGLTKLDAIEFRSREQEQAENIRKMIVAIRRHPSAADQAGRPAARHAHPREHARREAAAKATRPWRCAPLAHRLGMQQ